MNPSLLLWTGIAIIGTSLLYAKRAKGKNILETDEPEPIDDFPEVYTKAPSGYRRAKQSEVTANMSGMAKQSLSFELGTLRGPYVNENGVSYYIGVETHKNEAKGKHKGASVFIAT